MANAVIVDNNNNSRELLKSYLENFGFVDNIYLFDDLKSIDCDLKNINICIFDITSKTALENLVIVNEFKRKYKNLNFIAISYEINSELVARILKENVSDFLIKPIIPNILSASISKILDKARNAQLKKAKTICYFSTKGGSGKTSLALNSAYEVAAQTDEKVCLLDLSFNFGDIATYLDINPRHTILSAAQKLEHSDKTLAYTICEQYKNSNLYVLSFVEDMTLASKCSLPDLVNKLINSLKNIFDYIIIDMPNITDETTISIIKASDLVILISMLNMASIRNCQKMFELLNNIGVSSSKVRVVLNRYIENSEIKQEDFKNATDAEIFHRIPNNYLTLIDAINMGCPVSEVNPNSNIAKSYRNIAEKIIDIDYTGLEENKNYNHGIFNLLRRMGE